MRKHISGFSNPTVKCLRGLREKKLRKRAGRFLVEGLRLLEDARACGHLPVGLVMAEGRDEHQLLTRLEDEVEANGGDIITTTPDILAKITGKSNSQSVIGVFDEFDTGLARLDRSAADIWLVAQDLRDPGNLGTMLRTCDAVGAGGLILIDDCADPFSAEAVRASMGALFTVSLARARWEEFVPWLREGDVADAGCAGGVSGMGAESGSDAVLGEKAGEDAGSKRAKAALNFGGAWQAEAKPAQLVAASLRDAVPYRGAPYAAPCFILIGNESQGLPEAYEEECDLRVTMPMMGRADSLNAAVAGAVLAYEVLAGLGE